MLTRVIRFPLILVFILFFFGCTPPKTESTVDPAYARTRFHSVAMLPIGGYGITAVSTSYQQQVYTYIGNVLRQKHRRLSTLIMPPDVSRHLTREQSELLIRIERAYQEQRVPDGNDIDALLTALNVDGLLYCRNRNCVMGNRSSVELECGLYGRVNSKARVLWATQCAATDTNLPAGIGYGEVFLRGIEQVMGEMPAGR